MLSDTNLSFNPIIAQEQKAHLAEIYNLKNELLVRNTDDYSPKKSSEIEQVCILAITEYFLPKNRNIIAQVQSKKLSNLIFFLDMLYKIR